MSEGHSLEAAIDRLYQLPLAEFTAARNALAAERKAAADKQGAARVKALPKATAVAWAVNQVYARERERCDALVAATLEVASAQREGLSGGGGGALRDASRRRAEVLSDLARRAEQALVESGSAGGPAILQRLTVTLEALASPRAPGQAPFQWGRLAEELQPSGFDLALGLGGLDLPPVATRPSLEKTDDATPSVESPTEAMTREAQDRLRHAEAEAGRLRRDVEAATRSFEEAEARATAALSDVSGLQARLEDARARVVRHTTAAEEARRTLEGLRASLTAAEARRGGLEGSG